MLSESHVWSACASNLLVLSRDLVRAVAVTHGGAGDPRATRVLYRGLVIECGSREMQCRRDTPE